MVADFSQGGMVACVMLASNLAKKQFISSTSAPSVGAALLVLPLKFVMCCMCTCLCYILRGSSVFFLAFFSFLMALFSSAWVELDCDSFPWSEGGVAAFWELLDLASPDFLVVKSTDTLVDCDFVGAAFDVNSLSIFFQISLSKQVPLSVSGTYIADL